MLTTLTLCAGLALMAAPPNGQAKAEQPKTEQPKTEEFELLPVEAKVIEKTNAERVRHGLRPLLMDRGLVRSARRHTAWMTNRRTMQHSGGVAENIAVGQPSSDAVIQAWMNSSGHRANMLNTGYTKIGVAAYSTPDGTIYWCQQFQR